MKHAFLPALALVTLASAQPPVKLVPYVYSRSAPADLDGLWTVDPRQSAGLYKYLTNPAERVFAATVEYESAPARTGEADVTIRVFPVAQRNNGTYIYGNLKTGAYRSSGQRCTGEFKMDDKTRRVVEWRGVCGQGNAQQNVPLRLFRQ